MSFLSSWSGLEATFTLKISYDKLVAIVRVDTIDAIFVFANSLTSFISLGQNTVVKAKQHLEEARITLLAS